jgi:hypothetical protein
LRRLVERNCIRPGGVAAARPNLDVAAVHPVE